MAKTNPKKEMVQRFAELRKRSPALDDKILEQFEQHNINLMKSVFVILENEEGLRRAFEESGLDPANPVHWKYVPGCASDVSASTHYNLSAAEDADHASRVSEHLGGHYHDEVYVLLGGAALRGG